MRKTLITFGALALFTASPAFAEDPAGTIIGDDDNAVSLATGGGAGPADGDIGADTLSNTVGQDDQAFSEGVNVGNGTPVRMLPVFAQDDMRTIGGGEDAFSPTSAGS